MCEFKKGDKVICINTDNHQELIKDKIYEVEKPNGDFVYLKGCEYGYFTFLFRKECDYCKEKNIITIDGVLAIYINNQNKLKAITTKGEFGADINYCPMCGRKLGGTKQ